MKWGTLVIQYANMFPFSSNVLYEISYVVKLLSLLFCIHMYEYSLCVIILGIKTWNINWLLGIEFTFHRNWRCYSWHARYSQWTISWSNWIHFVVQHQVPLNPLEYKISFYVYVWILVHSLYMSLKMLHRFLVTPVCCTYHQSPSP
jgi:hypothetical protein